MLPSSKIIAPALALLAMLPGTALAVDPEAFAAKLEAAFTSDEVKIDLGTGTETADGLSFPDAKFVRPKGNDDPIPAALTFSGVTELDDGGYAVELITTPDIAFSDDDIAFSATDFRLEHINIAGTPGSMVFTEGMYRDSRGSIGRIGMTHKGEEMWSIGAITVATSIDGGEADVPMRSEAQFAIDDVFANFAVNPTDEMEAFTAAFEQSEFTGRLSGGWTYDGKTQLLSLDSLAMTLDGLGDLKLDFSSGGWTPQFLTALQTNLAQVQTLEANGGSAEEIAKAQTALGMQLLVQLTFLGAGVTYEDHGLFNRTIDFIAESEKEDRATIIAGLNIMAVQGLVQAGLTDLAAKVSTEVSKFLANPQSFEISARPASPVSLILLSAAAVQPQLILNMLNLTVAANAGEPATEDDARQPGADRAPGPDRIERPERQDDSAPRGGIPRAPRN